MDDMLEIRDRLARAEERIINTEKNFQAFKQDDFQSLKADVHSMRGELNAKIDSLIKLVDGMRFTTAKWMGGATVLIGLAQFILKAYFGG